MENRVKLCLFDDYWISFRPGTLRRWFEPEYVSAWTDNDFYNNLYCQLLCDRERGKYRLYYEIRPEPLSAGKSQRRHLALAESDDLLSFTPVEVNHDPEKRMRRVVFTGPCGVNGAGVLYDPHDPDPTRRYKLCAMTDREAPDIPMGYNAVTLAFSPDGLHWEHHPEMTVCDTTSDTYNALFYNPCLGEYALLHRSAYVDRRIAIKTSRDLLRWSPPEILLHPGAGNNDSSIQTMFYSMGASWQDGVFLGLNNTYHASLVDMDYTKMMGWMDTELYYSYDGRHFLRTSGRPVVPRPLPPAYGCKQLALTSVCESLDGAEYILCGLGSRLKHGNYQSFSTEAAGLPGNPSASVVYRIRKDGFCGLEGFGKSSQVVFLPMQLQKDDLTLNVRADCGRVRVGIQQRDGTFFEGFSLEDSVPFTLGSSVALRPVWREARLESLIGKQVRLVVELDGAILHAVSVTARPFIARPQAGYGDPRQLGPEA